MSSFCPAPALPRGSPTSCSSPCVEWRPACAQGTARAGRVRRDAKASLRAIPRRDDHLYFLTRQAHSATPRRGVQGFPAPETRSTSGRHDPSSRCCKSSICQTTPAAPAFPPANRPLAHTSPRDVSPHTAGGLWQCSGATSPGQHQRAGTVQPV